MRLAVDSSARRQHADAARRLLADKGAADAVAEASAEPGASPSPDEVGAASNAASEIALEALDIEFDGAVGEALEGGGFRVGGREEERSVVSAGDEGRTGGGGRGRCNRRVMGRDGEGVGVERRQGQARGQRQVGNSDHGGGCDGRSMRLVGLRLEEEGVVGGEPPRLQK